MAEDPRRAATCSRGSRRASRPRRGRSVRLSRAAARACPNSMRCAPTACRTAGSRSDIRCSCPQRAAAARRRPTTRSTQSPRAAGGAALRLRRAAVPTPASTWWCCRMRSSWRAIRTTTLREVERVLVPEGRVVIVGFNPASLWGLRQRLGAIAARGSARVAAPLFLPRAGEFIGYRRLRDWLRLLELRGRGRPLRLLPPAGALAASGSTASPGWKRAGDRWWPVFGAVYFVVAVKRVRGMRLVGLARQREAQAQGRSGGGGAPASRAGRSRLNVAAHAPCAARRRRGAWGNMSDSVVDLHRRGLQGQPGPGRLGRLLRWRARERAVRRRDATPPTTAWNSPR